MLSTLFSTSPVSPFPVSPNYYYFFITHERKSHKKKPPSPGTNGTQICHFWTQTSPYWGLPKHLGSGSPRHRSGFISQPQPRGAYLVGSSWGTSGHPVSPGRHVPIPYPQLRPPPSSLWGFFWGAGTPTAQPPPRTHGCQAQGALCPLPPSSQLRPHPCLSFPLWVDAPRGRGFFFFGVGATEPLSQCPAGTAAGPGCPPSR